MTQPNKFYMRDGKSHTTNCFKFNHFHCMGAKGQCECDCHKCVHEWYQFGQFMKECRKCKRPEIASIEELEELEG